MSELPFPVGECRRQFPALALPGNPIYFDGPAGSQVPERVLDAMRNYSVQHNANCHGAFATSRASDALLDEAHRAVADLVGTEDPDTVYFGANMTSLTFALSRALGRTWRSGDEVVVTRLDHDANFTPWVLAARDAGAKIQYVAIRPDCTLDLDDLRSKLSSRTRLVAVGCASNAVGTINPVRQIVELAHAQGAEVFLDAVHYAPHGLIDVEAWGCDYLACSAYKFFGPHIGMMWGRRDRLAELEAYKLRPATNDLPGKWMTGTQNHEGIAGTLAAVEYLAEIGRTVCATAGSRRERLVAAFTAIGSYERELAARLLRGLAELPDVQVLGIADPARLAERVPTVSILHRRLNPAEVAERLDRQGIYVWHGNFYALPLTEALGLEPEGMVRIGLLHYNTISEVERLLAALGTL